MQLCRWGIEFLRELRGQFSLRGYFTRAPSVKTLYVEITAVQATTHAVELNVFVQDLCTQAYRSNEFADSINKTRRHQPFHKPCGDSVHQFTSAKVIVESSCLSSLTHIT